MQKADKEVKVPNSISMSNKEEKIKSLCLCTDRRSEDQSCGPDRSEEACPEESAHVC